MLDISDPYYKSFWDRGIRKMVTVPCSDTVVNDSLRMQMAQTLNKFEFDQAGNIVYRYNAFESERRTYDEKHYVIRINHQSDVDGDIKFTYEFYPDKNQLVSKIFDVTGHISDSLDMEATSLRLFQFDEDGNVVKEVDNAGVVLADYQYNKNLLITKRVYYDGRIVRTYLYEYDDLAVLRKRIFEDVDSGTTEEDEFDDSGLLLRTIKKWRHGSQICFAYEFEFF